MAERGKTLKRGFWPPIVTIRCHKSLRHTPFKLCVQHGHEYTGVR
jgi:hypothetical protein